MHAHLYTLRFACISAATTCMYTSFLQAQKEKNPCDTRGNRRTWRRRGLRDTKNVRSPIPIPIPRSRSPDPDPPIPIPIPILRLKVKQFELWIQLRAQQGWSQEEVLASSAGHLWVCHSVVCFLFFLFLLEAFYIHSLQQETWIGRGSCCCCSPLASCYTYTAIMLLMTSAGYRKRSRRRYLINWRCLFLCFLFSTSISDASLSTYLLYSSQAATTALGNDGAVIAELPQHLKNWCPEGSTYFIFFIYSSPPACASIHVCMHACNRLPLRGGAIQLLMMRTKREENKRECNGVYRQTDSQQLLLPFFQVYPQLINEDFIKTINA